ncbi:hypothetical protein M569_04000, partial [Genlisea aurea]
RTVVYPPPMLNLPRTMKKYATDDGRLIITEEKVERQEYFQATRSEGRLVLSLVNISE